MLTKETTDEIARLYKSGQTMKQVGQVYGCGRENIRQILKRIGIQSRCSGRKQSISDPRIRYLFHVKEMTITAIAKEFHVCPANVKRALPEYINNTFYMERKLDKYGDQMLKRYVSGDGYPRIAKEFGIDVKGFRRYLVNHGITIRPVGRYGRS